MRGITLCIPFASHINPGSHGAGRNRDKEDIVRKVATLTLGILFLFFIAASINASEEKFNSSLRFLKQHHDDPGRRALIAGAGIAAAAEEAVVVTVKFDHVLSPAEIDAYERLGVSFYYFDGEIARTGPIYPTRIPWSVLDPVAGRTEVARLDAGWKPAIYPLLDVSRPEIQADSAWTYDDPLGYPISGTGMRIADFDTGIDVFHPSFFFADGDTFDWIDVNSSNTFSPGIDAVDLNGNGSYDTGEILDFTDGWIYDPAQVWGPGYPSNCDLVYQTYWDWLYNDANDNGERDYGPASGYTEGDPTFGEPFFIALDDDEDGVLDIGEKIVALGTSKIYATMNGGEVERLRGVDLINSDDDSNGHGTAVSGVLAGGTPGRHRFAGIAPDAEILMGYFFSSVPISALVPWARSREADAMLYEFGGFVFDYLDGSTLEEEIITTENRTIIQITPSGNLGRGKKHLLHTIPAVTTEPLNFLAKAYYGDLMTIWNTTLWRTAENDLGFKLKSPLGGEVTLEGSVSSLDGYYIWFDKSTSSRGTVKLDLYISADMNPNVHGSWYLTVSNYTSEPIEIISNVADDRSSWADGVEWEYYYSDQRNVTWPATCDSALVNGSYSTRGFEGYGGVGSGSIPPGEISAFSGRGTRVDGWPLLDICSPGNYDVYSTRTHQDGGGYPAGSYRQFSGTSAAGPHVAAAAALVQQAFPNATMAEIEFLLTRHAAEDAFTGIVYNDTWGWGKLRILGAIGVATSVEEMADGAIPPHLLLDSNYPNPFNPTTWIPFYVPSDGTVSLCVYNVKGEMVKVLKDKRMGRGAHSARWNGRDRKGHPVASGVYFCVLKHGGKTESRKLVLLR